MTPNHLLKVCWAKASNRTPSVGGLLKLYSLLKTHLVYEAQALRPTIDFGLILRGNFE